MTRSTTLSHELVLSVCRQPRRAASLDARAPASEALLIGLQLLSAPTCASTQSRTVAVHCNAQRSAVRIQPAYKDMATPCPDDDDEQRALALNEKAKALWRTFCENGASQPLDEAIAALEDGIRISQSDTIARAKCLINIGVFLSDRARLRGSAQDLRASIDFLRQASQVAPPQFISTSLLNLGNSLQEQFNFDRNQQHALDEAIEVYEEALAGSPTDSDRPKLQNGISAASLSRFSISDDAADLERASCFGQ